LAENYNGQCTIDVNDPIYNVFFQILDPKLNFIYRDGKKVVNVTFRSFEFIYFDVCIQIVLLKNISAKSEFDSSISSLFDWHMREGAFERLNPPWRPFHIISKKGNIDNGGTVIIKLPLIRNINIYWYVKHKDYVKDETFTDIQTKGIFSHWEHQHNFFDYEKKSVLEDNIKYNLPLGPVGNIFSSVIKNNLNSMFQYRHRITRMDLETHQMYKNSQIKNIIISGSRGFIGTALIPFLTAGGYNITRILRDRSAVSSTSEYDIAKKMYLNLSDSPSLSDSPISDIDGKFDVIINLNGENIFGIWSKSKKQKIFESRVKFTQNLCKKVSEMDKPPKVLISASAIGIYGNDDNVIFSDTNELNENENENENENSDYLSYVCKEWEKATEIAKNAGIRVVNLRTGIVLGSSGGILKKLMILNKLKTNVRLDSDNWLSWISLDDLSRIILFCMCNNDIHGAVNAVSPNLVKYSEFIKVLEKIWNTRLNIRLSSKIMEKVLGEMSKYTILSNTKATPKKLVLNGFNFMLDDLEMALRHTLGKVTKANGKI
jgi:uncharacterized protein